MFKLSVKSVITLAIVLTAAIGFCQNIITECFDNISKNGIPEGWAANRFVKYPTASKTDNPGGTADLSIKKSGSGSLKISLQDQDNYFVAYPKNSIPVSPGTYNFSMWVKDEGCEFWVVLSVYDKDGKVIEKRYMTCFKTKMSIFDWKKFESIVTLNPGEYGVKPVVHVKHKGTVWFDDLSFVPHAIDQKDAIAFRLHPNYYIDDNIYYMPERSPQIVRFAVKNTIGHKPDGAPEVVIELPEGISVIGADHASKQLDAPQMIDLKGEKYVRYNYSMGYADNILRNKDFIKGANLRALDLVMQSNLPPTENVLPAYIYFRDKSIECNPYEFRLKTISPLAAVKTPKRFFSGVSAGSSLEFYGSALEAFADYYRSLGFNAIHTSKSLRALAANNNRDISPINYAFKKRGITIFCNPGSPFANAYQLYETGSGRKIHQEYMLKNADGKTSYGTYDPAYIIQDGKFFREELQALLKTLDKEGFDHLQPNWEPFIFGMDSGSFTERSMRGFAQFMNVPYETIKNDSPEQILAKHKEQLIAYQKWQFSKTNEVIKQEVDKFSAEINRNVMFIPMLGPQTLADELPADCWKRDNFKTVMSDSSLPYFSGVCSWEYPHFRADDCNNQLYKLGYRRLEFARFGIHNTAYDIALKRTEQIVDWLDKQAEKNGTERLPYFHLAQGIQVNTWVVEPQAIATQMLAAFVGGAVGVSFWQFPMGYDGRYWQSAARANDLIAFYEDYILDGSKVKIFIELKSPMELFNANIYKNFLQARTFKHKKQYLLSLMNFDLLDKAIFSMKFSDLPAGEYVLHNPYNKTFFSLDGKKALTSNLLEKLVLSVPSNSIEFLVLEPYDKNKNYGKEIDNTSLAKTLLAEVHDLNMQFRERLKQISKIINGDVGDFNAAADQPLH